MGARRGRGGVRGAGGRHDPLRRRRRRARRRRRRTGAGLVTRPPPGARTIDEILAAARERLQRLTPRQAFSELAGGAMLVDIRPAAQRAAEGGVPGAVVIARNVLEWRVEPA